MNNVIFTVCKQNICKTYCVHVAKIRPRTHQCNIVAKHQLVNNSENGRKILTNRHSGLLEVAANMRPNKIHFLPFLSHDQNIQNNFFFNLK